jgi:hypothetical protein
MYMLYITAHVPQYLKSPIISPCHNNILFLTEEAPHMRDIVLEETMYDMDKNRDGVITLEEYISKL